jgi:hypothetical protein
VEFVCRSPFFLEVCDDDFLLGSQCLNFLFPDGQVIVQSVHLAAHRLE